MPQLYRYLSLVILLLLLGVAFWPSREEGPRTYYEIVQPGPRDPGKMSGASHAMDLWWNSRAYPNDVIDMQALSAAHQEHKLNATAGNKTSSNAWEAIGPHNVGGRTLRILFNPQNENTLWLGSAGGGLWVSHTAGVGADAWQRVSTGFPVLGVAAIAINPLDTNEMYIGTGEVYNYQKVGNRVAIRTTRGSYGIGILKSTDGGVTWSKSLDWGYSELKGVQDMLINPQNPNTVFAATSEGIYRSLDAGATWNVVETMLMATDLEYHPTDTNVLVAALGNFATFGHGIYRSLDGGATWNKSLSGLPTSYTGKATLSVTADAPYLWYASIADSLAGIGLYRSTNNGASWAQINNTDYALYQGWYSHDVGVSPFDRDWVMCVGVDAWKSADGGASLGRVSFWFNWFLNFAPTIGGQEGSADYVHADIHEIVYHPSNPNTVYFATDGGVFRSQDQATTFTGHNGRLQTTQFYANLSNSTQDSNLAIGGLQDNSTVVYDGTKAWYKVIGGDGCHTEINPQDDNVIYGSAQYLYLAKSTNRGVSFDPLSLPSGGSFNTAFVSPYSMCDAFPDLLVAARNEVYTSTNGGNTWNIATSTINSRPVLKIEIDPTNCTTIWASMVPGNGIRSQLYRSTDFGNSWLDVTGTLPDRYYHDIAVNLQDANQAYVALGGFGTDHAFTTTDAGATWTSISNGLPDVPANNILPDPQNPSILYLANDLGVYVSTDAGANWTSYSTDLPEAVIGMDLSYSPANRKLRLATHGNGVFEVDMLSPIVGIAPPVDREFVAALVPNPAVDQSRLRFELPEAASGRIEVRAIDGRAVVAPLDMDLGSGVHEIALPVNELAAGTYLVNVTFGELHTVERLLVTN